LNLNNWQKKQGIKKNESGSSTFFYNLPFVF